MAIGLLGKKVGMTRVFDEKGTSVPVTVIHAGPCHVVQVKTRERDGYNAVQLGFLEKRSSLVKKPEFYHFQKYGCKPMKHLQEFRVEDPEEVKDKKVFTVEILKPGDTVDIVGYSKGRGFQGVVKRWGFGGGRASHGAENHRKPGSIGQCADPSRVFKNKKMPGRMGPKRVKVKNCLVVRVDPERNILCVKGAVPGHRNGLLRIEPKKGSET